MLKLILKVKLIENLNNYMEKLYKENLRNRQFRNYLGILFAELKFYFYTNVI